MVLFRKISLGLFVFVIILLAIIMGGMRLAISNIDYFKPEIGYLLERDVSKGIVFTGVSGEMNRFNPVLRISNVSINLPDRSQPLFIDRLAVEFDFWASLRERVPIVLEVTGQLEKLELVKDASGRWWTNELEIGGGADPLELPGFARALSLLPRYLRLDLRRLIIQDQKTNVSHQLERVSARINHQDHRFFTQLSAALPEQLGSGVLLKAILEPRQSEIYINASKLRLPAIASVFDVDTRGLKDGVFDGEFWVNMSGYQVISVNGDVVLNQGVLQVAADKKPLAVDYHTRFNVTGRPESWRITNDTDRLRIDGENVLGFTSHVEVANTPEQTVISAWIERLQVSSLPVIAGQWLPPGISQQIAQGKIQGILRDVLLSIDPAKPEEFRMSSRAQDLSSKAFAQYPGTTNLNAELLLGDNKLGVKLYGERISLDFADQFRAPLELDALTLNAQASLLESGAVVVTLDDIEARNQDVSLSGRMWLLADQTERPFMFLRANFKNANAASAGKYMPIKLMPKATMEWLDRGIKGGLAPAGELQFHGRLRDIRKLAQARAGEFFVDFDVERGNVLFAPDWLDARNGNGRILFHNAGLEFDLQQVSYEKIDKARAKGRIANFDNAVLDLEIETRAPTADAMRVWIESPVGKPFRAAVANLHDFGGQVAANIQIHMPLGKDEQKPRVQVDLDFDNASVKAQNWALDLSRINGRLQVTDDRMLARQLDARFFGDPVKIDVDSATQGRDVLVKVGGLIESGNLLRRLPIEPTEYMVGRSDWQVRLKIAGDTVPDNQPYLVINAASNLQNTFISLPEPLGKQKEKSQRVSADLEFFSEKIGFKMVFGEAIRAHGRLHNPDDKGFTIAAIDLAFGVPLRPEAEPGLHLYGDIAEVSVEPWLDRLKRSGKGDPLLLQDADLKIRRVDAFDRILDNVQLELRQTNQKFRGSVESSLLTGSFEVPGKVSPQNPALFNLSYLQIDKVEREASFTLLPGDLFDFHLNSEVLVFHDMAFVDLVVEGGPKHDALRIDKLNFRRDKVVLSSNGLWEYDRGQDRHLSSINVTVNGSELGQALAGIGFGDSIQDGSIELEGGFTWPASLPGFSLDSFVGEASLRMEDGVLNNVEPGTGRFVGLLSLNALPRRLALDFSDVVIKGMEFDKITGTYRVEGGVLYTEDTRMDGPAAKIKISGRTGLVDRNYDQTIRVTPKIRQTLPILGTVAAGSTVGWGLLLLQNLFKKSIDDAVEVVYQITGSWDDPQIELLKAVDENQQELPRIDVQNEK